MKNRGNVGRKIRNQEKFEIKERINKIKNKNETYMSNNSFKSHFYFNFFFDLVFIFNFFLVVSVLSKMLENGFHSHQFIMNNSFIFYFLFKYCCFCIYYWGLNEFVFGICSKSTQRSTFSATWWTSAFMDKC